MNDFKKLAILDRYGFRLSLRATFSEFAPQAARPCFATIAGGFAIWEVGSDVDGWAVVGDDPAELIDLTIDTLDACDIPEVAA